MNQTKVNQYSSGKKARQCKQPLIVGATKIRPRRKQRKYEIASQRRAEELFYKFSVESDVNNETILALRSSTKIQLKLLQTSMNHGKCTYQKAYNFRKEEEALFEG